MNKHEHKNHFGNRRFLAAALATFLMLTAYPISSFAAVRQEVAVEYLVAAGIYRGDENGNLNLDDGLTRAELAVILTRLDFKKDEDMNKWVASNIPQGAQSQNFTDVPGWAAPHVAYCRATGYVNGVGENRFDPNGQVNPKMVCTVVMRWLKIQETDWDYDTSVTKAQNIGLTEDANVNGATIARGDMAVVLFRAIGGKYSTSPKTPTTPTPTPPPQATTPDEAPAMTIEEMRAEIVRLTNEERAKAGLNPLEVLPELMNCAQAKAQDIIDTGYHAHYSPNYGTHNEMIKSFVPSVKGGWEINTYGPASTPQVAFQYWLNSKEHHKAILEESTTHLGVGVVFGDNGRSAWVQQFIELK
jgi:uncharacterized protein YkwD